jgi:hypothetical protein
MELGVDNEGNIRLDMLRGDRCLQSFKFDRCTCMDWIGLDWIGLDGPMHGGMDVNMCTTYVMLY